MVTLNQVFNFFILSKVFDSKYFSTSLTIRKKKRSRCMPKTTSISYKHMHIKTKKKEYIRTLCVFFCGGEMQSYVHIKISLKRKVGPRIYFLKNNWNKFFFFANFVVETKNWLEHWIYFTESVNSVTTMTWCLE